MRMLTRDDVKALTADQKLELMDLLSESLEEEQIPVSPEVRNEVESRLKTYDEDKKVAMPWRDALRRLTP
jgi:putative addiction module component (TIGR02574 family)